MNTLKDALAFVETTLNQYLLQQFALNEKVVVLNHLVDQDGTPSKRNSNKLVITLINLSQETTKAFHGGFTDNSAGTAARRINPAIRFNVDLLFTACFEDYLEALKFLNATIAFFQINPLFNKNNFPLFPDDVEKLTFEVEDSDYFATHNLWSAMGAKYQPSIIYKVRHITVQADHIASTVPTVLNTDENASPQ